MSAMQKIFEESLKNYTGSHANGLVVEAFTAKCEAELRRCFSVWINPVYTGEVALGPVAEVEIEVDDSAYASVCLMDEEGHCMVSDGAAPDLYDLKLDELALDDPELVTQFLALCLKNALVEACKAAEFLSLPRAEKVVFSVGQHAGWQSDELYVHKGDRYEIDYGNVRLKRLHHRATCYTASGTTERIFMDHLSKLDVQACADELMIVFEDFLNWLYEQNPPSLEWIAIGWSSNFDEKTAFDGHDGTNLYRWYGTFDFNKWLSDERSEDLDEGTMVSVRYSVSVKIAEIACLASEKLVELEVFKKIQKMDKFVMKVVNRTAGSPPLFYPFS